MSPVHSDWHGSDLLYLLERAHRERSGAIEPALVVRPLVEREEGAAVAGCAVTEARRPCAAAPRCRATSPAASRRASASSPGGRVARLVTRPGAPWHHWTRIGKSSAQYGSAAVGQLTRVPSCTANVAAVSESSIFGSRRAAHHRSTLPPRSSEWTFEAKPWPGADAPDQPAATVLDPEAAAVYCGSMRNCSSNASAHGEPDVAPAVIACLLVEVEGSQHRPRGAVEQLVRRVVGVRHDEVEQPILLLGASARASTRRAARRPRRASGRATSAASPCA